MYIFKNSFKIQRCSSFIDFIFCCYFWFTRILFERKMYLWTCSTPCCNHTAHAHYLQCSLAFCNYNFVSKIVFQLYLPFQSLFNAATTHRSDTRCHPSHAHGAWHPHACPSSHHACARTPHAAVETGQPHRQLPASGPTIFRPRYSKYLVFCCLNDFINVAKLSLNVFITNSSLFSM